MCTWSNRELKSELVLVGSVIACCSLNPYEGQVNRELELELVLVGSVIACCSLNPYEGQVNRELELS